MTHIVDTKATLWHNMHALMVEHYGKEHLTRLAEECDIGPATATRIKQQKTSVGMDVIERIAARFDVEAWQLLVPGFDAKNPPVLQPVNEFERRLRDSIRNVAQLIAAEPNKTYGPGNE